MPDLAPATTAGQESAVPPEAAASSPSPVTTPEQRERDLPAAAEPAAASPEAAAVSPVEQRERELPAVPEIAQPKPIRVPQQPSVIGMQAATLYAEPVDPNPAGEDRIWKWMKLVLVIIAVVVALAALGLSLSTLKFPSEIKIVKTGSFIASTVPLLGLVIIWSAAELATRFFTKGKRGTNPNAAVSMWLVIWIFAFAIVTTWAIIADYSDSSYDDFPAFGDYTQGYDDDGGSNGGGNTGGYTGGDSGSGNGGSSGGDSGGSFYGDYYDDGFGSESNNGGSSGSSYGSGTDGFGGSDSYGYGSDYATSANTTLNKARSILRRDIDNEQGFALRRIVIADTILIGIILLVSFVIFIGDCIAAKRYNTRLQPVSKTQPDQSENGSTDAASNTTARPNRGWVLAKHAAYACALVIAIANSVLSLSIFEYGGIDYYDYDTITSLFPISSVIPLFTIFWILAEYATQICRKFKKGIHPGAHVGVWLCIWIGAAVLCGMQTVAAALARDDCLEYNLRKDSPRWRYRLDECEPEAKIPRAIAAASFTFLLFLASTFIFVAACADTDRRHSTAAKAIMYVPVPYGHMGAAPQQLQVQPQTVKLPSGQVALAYPMPPQMAYGQQPYVPQPQMHEMQPHVSQAQPQTQQGNQQGAPAAPATRQSQIMEYYGVAQ